MWRRFVLLLLLLCSLGCPAWGASTHHATTLSRTLPCTFTCPAPKTPKSWKFQAIPEGVTVSEFRFLASFAGYKARYDYGSKVPLGVHPGQLKQLDCSGWTRYALHRATVGRLTPPDGSWFQQRWAQDMVDKGRFRRVDYHSIRKLRGNRLFLCYMPPQINRRRVVKVAHIWFVLHDEQGWRTLECYSGRGIGSRPINTPVLMRRVRDCFEIPIQSCKTYG